MTILLNGLQMNASAAVGLSDGGEGGGGAAGASGTHHVANITHAPITTTEAPFVRSPFYKYRTEAIGIDKRNSKPHPSFLVRKIDAKNCFLLFCRLWKQFATCGLRLKSSFASSLALTKSNTSKRRWTSLILWRRWRFTLICFWRRRLAPPPTWNSFRLFEFYVCSSSRNTRKALRFFCTLSGKREERE